MERRRDNGCSMYYMQKIATNSDLQSFSDTYKPLIEEALHQILEDMRPDGIELESFKNSVNHALMLGGKRMRPLLAIAIYKLAADDVSSFIRSACAVELIHAGSLILDDLPCMDNALTRRGQTVTHALFGESTSILASAALWVRVFELYNNLQPAKSFYLTQKTSHYIGSQGLIQGQLLDLASFGDASNIKELERCYLLKTSSLFELATTIGCVYADVSNEATEKLINFSRLFGIAYQVRDDILDVTQATLKTGKDHNKDVENNKPSFVSILGVEKATRKLNSYLDDADLSLEGLDYDTSLLKNFTRTLRLA